MKYFYMALFSISIANATLVDKEAPSFELMNHENQKVSLAQFKGKTVVLEWLNYGCPYVKKHYNSGNMQATQKKVLELDKDTVWLSIISSAKGRQGYSTPEVASQDKAKNKSLANHILLDSSGEVGKLYAAKTTPHMFVINKAGKVEYEGAIDSIASSDTDDIPKAKNYILMVMSALNNNTKIATRKSKPYGCSVKY